MIDFFNVGSIPLSEEAHDRPFITHMVHVSVNTLNSTVVAYSETD